MRIANNQVFEELIPSISLGISKLNAETNKEQILYLRKEIDGLSEYAFKRLRQYFLARDISIINGLSIQLENKIKILNL